MKQKRYMNIERANDKHFRAFDKGDIIVIQEKVDGSNFSIAYDSETDSVASFSRNHKLKEDNNLRGAWEWSQTLDKDLVKSILGENKVLFGEWLVQHSVVYRNDCYSKPYFYDVWDIENQGYLPQTEVKEIVNKLNLIYIEPFYIGEFQSWEHVQSFVGKTTLGEYGEGVVVKNQTKLNNPNSRFPFYTKIVGNKFAEKKSVKPFDHTKIQRQAELVATVETVVTPARVQKQIFKLIDEGNLPEDWQPCDMKIIAENMGSMIYKDCLKEEPEVVEKVGKSFGAIAYKVAMEIATQILKEKNK